MSPVENTLRSTLPERAQEFFELGMGVGKAERRRLLAYSN